MEKRMRNVLCVVLILLFIPLFAYGSEKIVVAVGNATGTDSILYAMNPDGSGLTKLFDFHNHPKHVTGLIVTPRVSPDGRYIYFSSDNAFVYTPASRNIFRVASNGRKWEQITPGPNSGKWNQGCPCGVVEGTVRKANGAAWGNCPIYLEGMSLIYSKPDGTFRFDKVPEGRRWMLAYRPGSQVFDSQEVVVARGSVARVNFVPRSDFRWSFMSPALLGDRIYYRSGIKDIQWTDARSSRHTKVYTSTGSCTGITDVDGFDVAPSSGRIAVMDYQQGCPTNRGLYIADKNGGNMGLLVDMKADNRWCDGGEVYWSPDESKIAFKACFNWHVCFFVYNARTGAALGYLCAPDTKYNIHNTFLYGWSPDGRWLLYYMHPNNPAAGSMWKVEVNAQGAVDANSGICLGNNVNITGATWAKLN
jgi:WD40 repeat protein